MPLRADLLNPIAGDNPSGVDLRYDAITDKIKEARREDLDLKQGDWKTAVKTADYPQVVKLGSDALAKKGKDLQIAVWLVDAHVRREGFVLLEPGFQFLQNLLEQYWDTLYPELEDGDVELRSAPLAWFGSKLEEPISKLALTASKLTWIDYQESRLVGSEADANTPEKQEAREIKIKEGKLTAEEFDAAVDATPTSFYLDIWNALKAAHPALEALSEYCDVRFGEFSPSFIKTRVAIEGITDVVEKILRKKGGFPKEEGEQAEEEVEHADFGSEQVEEEVEEPSRAMTWEELNESVSEEAPSPSGKRETYARQIADLCRSMRAADGEDPAPYLIIRAMAWAQLLLDAPMINREALEAPPSSLRISLKRQAADSDWKNVLETTENAMSLPSGRTWLDLQRYTVQALSGAGYSGAARGVMTALRGILTDIPDMVDLTLPDDTPAANAETKEWLEQMVLERRYDFVPKPPGEESSDSSDSFGSDDSSSDFSSSEETPSEETPMDFGSLDMPTEETPSDDLGMSLDTPAEPEAEPEPELPPFQVDENPPILDEEEIAVPEGATDIFDQAIEAVQAGNTAEGLGIISKTLATERTGRARFKRRTQLAHLLMAGGQPKIAQPILDQLVSEIEERRLEDWEQSESLAYPLSLLLRCLATERDQSERRTQLYARICKLDPVRALNCSP